MTAALRQIASAIPGAQLSILVGLVAIFAMFILPMPQVLLDLFIAFNLTAAALLVIAVIGIARPLDFSTFPSILLFTTVTRLAISVATTRMILTEADGGHIVKQFGETAAGGNLVVGMVVFLIITVVQFIVISKGSERVAEVAARFSLDAMPGKQLSIDSDLRSGLLSKDEAREKRTLIEQESRLYGSLDGAMKFVKGDAIASIVIVLIALIGGIAIGTLSHGMSIGEAASTFAILSIGEGLVAQIPAFMCALAAGLLVTRSNDPDTAPELAPAMFAEVAARPGTLVSAGVVAIVLGSIPGFPYAVFYALGLTLLAAGLWRLPLTGDWLRAKLDRGMAEAAPAPKEIVLTAAPVARVAPLVLRVAAGERNAGEMRRLSDAIALQVKALQDRSGVALPDVLILGFDDARTVGAWELVAFDAPLGAAIEAPEAMDDRLPQLVRELLHRNLAIFLGLQEVTEQLDWLGETYPEVVKEAVRAVPVGTIVEVLRLLVDEQVSLRNMRDIVGAIGDAGQMEREASIVAERVRVAIRRNIVAPLCREGRLPVMMIGHRAEDAIRRTLTSIDGQQRLAIDPVQMRALVKLVASEVAQGGAAAILTAQDLRRPLRLVCAGDLFDVPVLSFNELNPAVPLDVVGQLEIAPELISHESFAEAAE